MAVVMVSAACAIDVTEYTPFARGGDNTRVARETKSDPIVTASVPRTERKAGQTVKQTAERTSEKPASVVVAPGDTLYRIARRHHTSVDRIARLNALDQPYVIRAGQRLVVPDGRAVAPASAPARSGAIRQITQSPVKGGVRVAAGDTLYSIARRHGVAVDDLMMANAIRDPSRIRPGQELILPYQRTAASGRLAAASPEITGSIPAATAKRRAPTPAEVAYNKVMSDYRVVPGQSILAPF